MTGEKARDVSQKFFLAAGIFLLLISAGCAKNEALKKVSTEEDLRERVTSYWNLKIQGAHSKCYEYELPQNRMTLENYIKRFSNPMMTYKGFEVERIEIRDGDIADVRLTVVPVLKVPGEKKAFENKTSIMERWVRMENIWYHTSKGSSNLSH